MTLDRKRLVSIGVEGALEVPSLESNTDQWVRLDPSRSALFLGVVQRNEDDIERALHTALKLTSSSRRLMVCETDVEITNDQVIFSWETFFQSIHRLQPGEILVSSEIARVYDRLFLFEIVEDPSGDLFFLRGERQRQTRIRGLRQIHAPLIGREKELTRLSELLNQIREDQGQIASLVGDPGIGKTRLMVALKEISTTQSIPWIDGAFSSRSGLPYEGIRQVVVSLIGAKIGTLSRWEMTDSETDFLRIFLDPGTPMERLAQMDDAQIRIGLFQAVRKLIHSAAREPLVIAIEDIHWADPASMELLEFLTEDLESTRLLLLLLFRPDFTPKWKDRLNYNEIRLQPLPQSGALSLALSLVKADRTNPETEQELIRLSKGNPLFLEELVREWMGAGALEVETDDFGKRILRLRPNASSALPTTLHTIIAARFDRLQTEEQEILRWASLLGSTFNIDELAEILKCNEQVFSENLLGGLTEKNYVREKSVYPRRDHQFVHDLIHESARSTLSERERQQRNRKIASFLLSGKADVVSENMDRAADHALQGDDDILAIHTALRAGKRAFETHQFLRAKYFFENAARLWELLPMTNPKPLNIFAPYVDCLLVIGILEEAGSALNRWEQRGVPRDPHSQGTFWSLKMRYHEKRTEPTLAIEASNQALSAYGADPRFERDRYAIIHDKCQSLMDNGQKDEALHTLYQALRDLNDGRYPEIRLRLWARAAFLAVGLGDVSEALDLIGKAKNLLTNTSPQWLRVELFVRISNTYQHAGQYEEAIRWMNEALNVSAQAGFLQAEGRAHQSRALLFDQIGNYDRAFADIDRALEISRKCKDRRTIVRATLARADFLSDLGAFEDAAGIWGPFRDEALASEDLHNQSVTAMVGASIAEGLRQYEEVLLLLNAAILMNEQYGNSHGASRSKFRRLRAEAFGKLRSNDVITADFESFMKEKGVFQNSMRGFTARTVGYSLAALGCPIVNLAVLDKEPTECPEAWLRHQFYAAKIRWLKHVGKSEEAEALTKAFKEDLNRIAIHVPNQYLKSFLNHPLHAI